MSEVLVTEPEVSKVSDGAPCVKKLPICVDLDGTLVRTDTLVECALTFVRRHPAKIFLLFFWLLKGRAFLKEQLAQNAEMDAKALPIREQLRVYLEKEKAGGREIFLATAANLRVAESMAASLPIFSGLFASDQLNNLSGVRKLEKLTARFGERGFIYAGNSRADVAIWRECGGAIVVDGTRRLLRALGEDVPVIRLFPREGWATRLRSAIREMRPYQWVKNTLVFLPLIGAHRIADPPFLLNALVAFASFSLCASAVYIINDLLDLKADRLHPEKRKRPLAAGDLSLQAGILLAGGLFAAGMMVAIALSAAFLALILLYIVLTFGYSLAFKKQPVLDVLLLAGLYTVRVFAGEVATGVRVSEWLLAFSMFIFLSLALLKRYSELVTTGAPGQVTTNGRGYRVSDSGMLATLGGAAGYMAVLVLALYINSDTVTVHYSQPRFLWLATPALLFWVSRIWLLAGRGEVHHDPIVFSFKDRTTQVILLLAAVLLFLAGPI